jgi:hypothetical protein
MTAPAPAAATLEGAAPSDARDEALRRLAEARRLLRAALEVHRAGRIDSAPVLRSALVALFAAVWIGRGGRHASGVAPSIHAAAELLRAEGSTFDVEGLLLVDDLATRFARLDAAVTREEARRYDAVVAAAPELFSELASAVRAALHTYADHVRWRRRAILAGIGLAAAAGAGIASLAPWRRGSFLGAYYRRVDFKDLAYRRRDASIDFDWGMGAPPGLPEDDFSVRWDAFLEVPDDGEYEIWMESDDGSRLYVDGSTAIDLWHDHQLLVRRTTLRLSRGPHRIRVDYFERRGPARIRLGWSSHAFSRRLIRGRDLG